MNDNEITNTTALQPCGHPIAAIAPHGTTHYCRWCALETKIEVLEGSICDFLGYSHIFYEDLCEAESELAALKAEVMPCP